jgi:hypothetical protein
MKDRVSMPKGIVGAAQAGGKMGKTAPAGGGKTMMPKGDGLKAAWSEKDRSRLIDMSAAKKKVR